MSIRCVLFVILRGTCYFCQYFSDQMKLLKEFFRASTTLKCFIFSLIVSLLYVLRFSYTKNIAFFSKITLTTYVAYTIINFILFLVIFFVLFVLANRGRENQ